MQYYLFGYLIICTLTWFSVDVRSSSNLRNAAFTVIGIGFIFFCGSRGVIDRDHQSYLNIYGYIVHGAGYLIEPTYYFFSYLSRWLTGGPLLIFILYSLAGVGFKLYAIKKYSIIPLVSLLVYFSNYYFLHEMTQIRIGVSIGLALIAINRWLNGHKNSATFILIVSFLFHYSALIFIIVPFLPKGKVKNSEFILYATIIAISYILYITSFGFAKIFSYIPIGYIQEKFSIYNQKTSMGEVDAINVFSVMQIIKLFVIITVYKFVPRSYCNSLFFNLMFRFYIYSAICWVIFFDIPVFAVRLSDIFGIAEIFIFPYLFYVSGKRLFGLVLITVLTSVIFYINIYHNQLLLPYNLFWLEENAF